MEAGPALLVSLLIVGACCGVPLFLLWAGGAMKKQAERGSTSTVVGDPHRRELSAKKPTADLD